MTSLASLARVAAPMALVGATVLSCSDSPHHAKDDAAGPVVKAVQQHSSSLVASPDGSHLFVAHPDVDSVSILDATTRGIEHEIVLSPGPPIRDAATGRYDVSVAPRSLALDSTGKTLFVTGERSGKLYRIDASRGVVLGVQDVCAEPIGVLVDSSDSRVFVACSQDAEIVELSASDLSVVARVPCPAKPWSLAWDSDGKTLFVTHLLGAGVSALDVAPLAVRVTWALADTPPGANPSVPHGIVRGLYDAAVRPGTNELWIAHLMLGTDTPQPVLDFKSTAFPALSLHDTHDGRPLDRLTVQASSGDGGAFGDVVSGPHAIAFSPDGKLALIVDTNSEDILVVDAVTRTEVQLVRPLPGHMPEGIVWASTGRVYLQERNSEDIVAFELSADTSSPELVRQGDAFASLSTDAMPADLRLGQRVFYSANSDDMALTQDHWVSCASCHLEGRSDAVVWEFAQGPRDTPSNAGGTRDTGFLFRTAARNQVQDYWKTINVEQGGHFSLDSSTQKPLLDALAAFVNDAIPVPVPPRVDVALRDRGAQIFVTTGCSSCHSGPAMTDSGAGNPSLDLGGDVVLHDVGTCVTTGDWLDVASEDKEGHPRSACAFDTPTLRGLWDSPPYFHDGSAATLDQVVNGPASHGGASHQLSTSDRGALVEFLKSLLSLSLSVSSAPFGEWGRWPEMSCGCLQLSFP